MELFNKSGILVATVLVSVGVLIGAQAKEDVLPPAPVIEAAAMQMNASGGSAVERRLREWADQGSAVARRELAMLYQDDVNRREEAMHLFEQAAKAGDVQSAARLAALYSEMHRAELDLKEAATAHSENLRRY